MATNSSEIPSYAKIGAASGGGVGATLVCYPFEMLKTRMQVSGEGTSKERLTTVQVVKKIYHSQGIPGFYKGLSASVLRQALYTGTRVGLFQVMIDHFTVGDKQPNVYVKAICGFLSGCCGGIVGLPPDVVMIRMMADGNVPPEKRRNYAGLFNAFSRIIKEEGPLTLYRGVVPVCVRAASMNISQLISYMKAKDFLISRGLMQNDYNCHIVSSLFSALIATYCVLPADIAKTRIQNQRHINGVPEYAHIIDVWAKIIKKEGVSALWKGFTPMFGRNAPQFIFLFVIYEKLISVYKKFAGIP